MKTLKISDVSIASLLLCVFTWNVSAGEAEITWNDPDKYRDVRPSNESKTRFQARIFKSFEEYFAQLSEKLPEGQMLKVNVTDVDLAGDVRFGTLHQIRIIKDIYIPRLKFTYELINKDKSIADSNEVDLKDMSFMMSSRTKMSSGQLYYEKRMLDKWFKETFIKNT